MSSSSLATHVCCACACSKFRENSHGHSPTQPRTSPAKTTGAVDDNCESDFVCELVVTRLSLWAVGDEGEGGVLTLDQEADEHEPVCAPTSLEELKRWWNKNDNSNNNKEDTVKVVNKNRQHGPCRRARNRRRRRRRCRCRRCRRVHVVVCLIINNITSSTTIHTAPAIRATQQTYYSFFSLGFSFIS